jgi:hypothetical protein
MGFFRYIKSLGQTNSGQSSKAFAVVISTIVSALMGITLCGVIAYDAYVDGVVNSDLQDMGILMICMGAFVGGSSVSKIFGDKAEARIAAEMDERLRGKILNEEREDEETN